MIIIDPHEGFKIVLHATVIIGELWIPKAINSGRNGHDLSLSRISCRLNVERSFYLEEPGRCFFSASRWTLCKIEIQEKETNLDKFVKSREFLKTSFRRKPKSIDLIMFWMQDQVRHDELRFFTSSSTLMES